MTVPPRKAEVTPRASGWMRLERCVRSTSTMNVRCDVGENAKPAARLWPGSVMPGLPEACTAKV